MTRGQVAKRLGKSLATVRRIEGVLLHSTQDSQGVHRFDPDEVETLARRIEAGDVALWQSLRDAGDRGEHSIDSEPRAAAAAISDLERQVEALRDQLENERVRHGRELAALRAENERERQQRQAEHREFELQAAELIAVLDDLSD